MDLDELGIMYLEGKYKYKYQAFRNIGELRVSSTKVFFEGEEENIEFNINDITNIELERRTGRLANNRLDNTKLCFNLKNGDAYSFFCYVDLTKVRGKEGINIMIKKTESLYHLLNKMINNKTYGDLYINELENYHSKQNAFQTEAQKISQKQAKDHKNKFWCEFGCMVLFPSIIVVIVILMMI